MQSFDSVPQVRNEKKHDTTECNKMSWSNSMECSFIRNVQECNFDVETDVHVPTQEEVN